MSVLKRQYMSAEGRREQVLAAGLRAFVRGGYHGTHVAHIVAEAGVARGTFYLYFKSKHDVFAALVDRMLQTFLDLPQELDPPAPDLRAAVTVVERRYRHLLTVLRQQRDLCRLLLEEAVGLDKGFREALERHYAEWQRRIIHWLEHLQQLGAARADLDLEITSQMVVGYVERIIRCYILPEPEPDLDRLVRALVQVELKGVLKGDVGIPEIR